MQLDEKHVDSILMYCSYFTYCDDKVALRRKICRTDVVQILDKMSKMEKSQKISTASYQALNAFLEANDGVQRDFLDKPVVS